MIYPKFQIPASFLFIKSINHASSRATSNRSLMTKDPDPEQECIIPPGLKKLQYLLWRITKEECYVCLTCCYYDPDKETKIDGWY